MSSENKGGVLSVVGRLPTPEDHQDVLLRLPVKLLAALDERRAGARVQVIGALIAHAVDRLMDGESIQLQAGDLEHWFK